MVLYCEDRISIGICYTWPDLNILVQEPLFDLVLCMFCVLHSPLRSSRSLEFAEQLAQRYYEQTGRRVRIDSTSKNALHDWSDKMVTKGYGKINKKNGE